MAEKATDNKLVVGLALAAVAYMMIGPNTVSYTHLTLPTIYSV